MTVNILAIDTTTEACSVALLIKSKKIFERFMITHRKHTQYILPMIDSLFFEANILLKDLNVIAFTQGPGSFTGVRISLGIAQGLALGANLPLIGVSTLAVLAESTWRKTGACAVLTAINARMNKVYLGQYYRQKEGFWIKEKPEQMVSNTMLIKLMSNIEGIWAFSGNGWNNNDLSLYKNNNQLQFIFFKKVLLPCARDILPLAVYQYRCGNFQSVDQVKPVYLQKYIIKNE